MPEQTLNRILYITDSHYGWERVGGVTRPIHDRKAHDIVLQIADDFKPTHIINGGDGLDSGAVGHHNKGKPRIVEGLRVADGSIMPEVVNATTNAACVMIGEKAADLLRAK